MKNAGLFIILFFKRKIFEKSTCFLLAGLTKECDCIKKVIFGGLLFIGGAIMYSIGTLGFADMDVQANYMLAP